MKTYYRSPDDKHEPADEFPGGVTEFDRRDFLKAAGFAVGAAALAGCSRAPVEKAIPFLKAPEGITPGRPYYLASTCGGCAAACGILVKCVDGRPIKLEGNPQHPLSRGGLCAVGQASVLELYDSLRLRAPLMNGRNASWKDVDDAIAARLTNARRVRVVTSTLASPALESQIDRFLSRFADGRRVTYDPLSASAIADAHAKTHGLRAVPHYRFDNADVIVSFDADFLGTWISPVEFTKQYAARRTPKDRSWHAQLEPRMSLTGSNADERIRIRPDEIGALLQQLPATIERRLKFGRTLVVSGSQDVDVQIAVNLLSERLGSYGTTIDLEHPSYQRTGNDSELAQLVSDLPALDALFVLGCNPVYDLPRFDVARVPLVVSFAERVDETAAHAHFVCPDHHFLESWRDNEPVAGVVSMTQPAVAPLGGTRAAIESFAVWSGAPASAYDLLRAQWKDLDWTKTLSEGYAELSVVAAVPGRPAGETPAATPRRPQSGKLALILYPSIAMLEGRHAHNPWLLELPDPISKITWDNVASFSPKRARELGIKDGDVVRVNGVELPAFVQPGQHDDVVAIAIGYGRKGTDRFAKIGPQWLLGRVQFAPGELVGKRVSHLGGEVTIEKTGRVRPIATTQLHSRLEGRDIVREESVGPALAGRPAEAGPHTGEAGSDTEQGKALWPGHAGGGAHQWAMAIDLSRCTGCSGCVVACQAENNVPVVGKDEVLREREMHWIRIDRYYSGDDSDPEVVHQPMMCHHCGNAPCESVCPVLATVHSSEGLNQQVYNRCVGTRYCANNCPYKARRFNWFDYPHNDRLQNMVLNPDVTVRSRGVMEKCSMCVQRIENARIEARRLGIPVADGAVQTACQQSCPADAIVFGDLKDPKSRINAARRDPRHYLVLEELNVKPAVGYLSVVRDKEEA